MNVKDKFNDSRRSNGVKVKICGITNLQDAKTALSAGADALGFVFAKSPRQVSVSKAREIIKKLGPFVVAVGVFVNESAQRVREIAAQCGLSAVQLHGDETAGYTKTLGCCKVIKAFRVDKSFQAKEIEDFKADAYLFDTKVSGKYGGSGESFDWQALSAQISNITSDGGSPQSVGEPVQKSRRRVWTSPTRFLAGRTRDIRDRVKYVIISGGLCPENVQQAIRILSPYAVDVSSGVEKKPGIKDPKLLKRFIYNAKKN